MKFGMIGHRVNCFTTFALATVLSQLYPNAISQETKITAFGIPSKSDGSSLFTQLDSAITNIVVDNAYDDPEMWGSRYREYKGGSMGSGVAAGDFNSDGNVDLYVSVKTKPGRLFKNLGGWTFEDVTESSGLSEEGSVFSWIKSAISSEEEVIWRHGAVFADVNNDGHLDLYVCRNGAPNFLYINQGDLAFLDSMVPHGIRNTGKGTCMYFDFQ